MPNVNEPDYTKMDADEVLTEFLKPNKPTTDEIVRALRKEARMELGGQAATIHLTTIQSVIDLIESQQREILQVTASIGTEKARADAAVADIEELLGQDDFIGICWACKSHDKCAGTRDVRITCVPKWRGLQPQEGEGK